MPPQDLVFERCRGIVWVCDLEGSTKLLNSPVYVDAIEQFLPRFHYLSRTVANVLGADHFKWIGDGFLAWFPLRLHRSCGERARLIIHHIDFLSGLTNVTRLGVHGDRFPCIRHGLALEHDAIASRITGIEGSTELIGRSIVLASRLAGLPSPYPSILIHKGLAVEAMESSESKLYFKRYPISQQNVDRYFKGERKGTDQIYALTSQKPRKPSLAAAVKKARQALDNLDSHKNVNMDHAVSLGILLARLEDGPQWVGPCIKAYVTFIRDEMGGALRQFIDLADSKMQRAHSPRSRRES